MRRRSTGVCVTELQRQQTAHHTDPDDVMPLYLGYPAQSGQTVSPAISARGLNLLRAAPSDVHYEVIPSETQPGYPSYITHLPSFIEAYYTRSRVSTRKEGYPIKTPHVDLIPILPPPLIVHFRKALTTPQLTQLEAIGYERTAIRGKTDVFIFQTYTSDDVKVIGTMDPDTITPTVINTCNIDSYVRYHLVRRLITGLLHTHSYPAFSDNDDPDLYTAAFEKDKKRKRSDRVEGMSGCYII